MAMLDGGELLARTLKQAGVDEIFALHGGHLESLFQGCVNNQIRLTDTRHEAAAGHAADGYARTTGRLGVCVVTAGPGFANAVTAILNAQLDASPTLFIVGAPPLREAETNPLQGGFDQMAMIAPAAKWAHRVTNPERIPVLAAQAVRTATTGRPGAVVLELPVDVLHMPVDPADVWPAHGLPRGRPRPSPSPAEAARVVEFLAGAERPAIMIGGGARLSDCGEALRRFVEQAGVPVVANTRARGLLPPDHPLNAGAFATLGVAAALKGLKADRVLLLGARLGLLTGGRSPGMLGADVRLAQVDIEPEEIGRVRDVEIAVCADAGSALEAFAAAAEGRSWPDWSAWAGTLAALRHADQMMFAAADPAAPLMHPYLAGKALVEAAQAQSRDPIFVLDGGEAAGWAEYHIRAQRPGSILGHGYLGCLGIGPGMAIGAQRAFPDRRVIHVTGDGAVGFHIQEFDTMVRHGLPIVTVILNNQVWGMSIHGQDAMYGPNRRVITELADTAYDSVAAAFGCHAERVEALSELPAAMERALASGRPACLNVMVDGAPVLPATLALLGGAGGGEDEIVIPYYENIPRRRTPVGA
ncbi:thiamine pyrophosphate-binding protein [Phenylobacterium sp.]|uniref:thiamine pyrophosphate-binding protein n=1 Tax=Phenylobacterium sp. TaxID=1871053 RepID=UPI0035B46151